MCSPVRALGAAHRWVPLGALAWPTDARLRLRSRGVWRRRHRNPQRRLKRDCITFKMLMLERAGRFTSSSLRVRRNSVCPWPWLVVSERLLLLILDVILVALVACAVLRAAAPLILLLVVLAVLLVVLVLLVV